MELIAALLHSPEVLFLDEPTIGLDVVAQHNIQQFLKYYQEKRQITILLTSHYMKDVAALCKRVVVVEEEGRFNTMDRLLESSISFSEYQDRYLAVGGRLGRHGFRTDWRDSVNRSPRFVFDVETKDVSRVLAELLQQYAVEDIAVEDPPLEEVIADFVARVDTPKG